MCTAWQGKVVESGFIVVQGLNGGEDVITSAPQNLRDGDKIKIKGQLKLQLRRSGIF